MLNTSNQAGLTSSLGAAVGSNPETMRHLIFVDAATSGLNAFIPSRASTQVISLDSNRDGIEQIASTLKQYRHLDSVHILSHGEAGQLKLGNATLSNANLSRYANSLKTWGEALSSDGDLLLYGCDVAAGDSGLAFSQRLSDLTGADIAASIDITGNAALGGDWELEAQIGTIDTSSLSLQDYQDILPTYNGNEYRLTSGAKSWEAAQAEARAAGGNLVAINDDAEQNWLRQTFSTTEKFWIGLTDRTTEGTFQWVNGDTSTYRYWAANEPNDYKFGGRFTAGEDYAMMNWTSGGRWNDMPNDYAGTYRGIIEIKGNGGGTGSAGSLALETETYSVNENAGTVNVAVVRTGGSAGTVTLDYNTVDQNAVAGSDYTANNGRITFAPGEIRKVIPIQIIDNTVAEGDERFTVTITNPQGGANLLAPRTSQVTIVDNDGTTSPLVGYWKMDESAIGTVTDSSGRGNSGRDVNMTSPSGGPTAGGPQLTNANPYSRKFDGLDDYISINDSASLNLSSGTFTESVWINSSSTDNAYRGIIGNGFGKSANQRYPGMWVYQGTKLHAGFGDGTNWNAFTTGDVIKPNTWTLVTTTFDGTTYKAYVDGKEVFSTNSFAGRKPVNVQQVDIGRVDNYFQGSIDEARIYNRALSAAEVQALYNQQPGNPGGGTIRSEAVFRGLSAPTAITWSPDKNLAFIAEKGGAVKVSRNGQAPSVFIDISSQVNAYGDRGLLDIAVHPNFPQTPYVYLAYTYDPPEAGNNGGLAARDAAGNRTGRLTRVTADAATGYTTAVPGSEVVLIGKNGTWNNFNAFVDSTDRNNINVAPAGILPDGSNLQDFIAMDSTSHFGGAIRFGQDGALYFSVGDGTSYNLVDPRSKRVQDVDNLSGKILRIDPITGKGLSNNPFYNGNADSNRSKVYQSGLRNPYRMTFVPSTDRLLIGDVGWTNWEEINSAGAGANFGWPWFEGGNNGSLRTVGYQDLDTAKAFYASNTPVNAPLVGLNHSDPVNPINAIILGDVYTGTKYGSQYQGDLFFSDVSRDIIRNVNFNPDGSVRSFETFTTAPNTKIVDIKNGPDGNLYYVSIVNGEIGRWVV